MLLEILVTEDVVFVEEVADIETAEGVHLAKGEDTGELNLGAFAVGFVPGDGYNIIVFFEGGNSHGHVVVGRYYLRGG